MQLKKCFSCRKTIHEYNLSGYINRIFDWYLDNRAIEYQADDGPELYKVSAGVSQGSILGRFLWNLMNGRLFNLTVIAVRGFKDDRLHLISSCRRQTVCSTNWDYDKRLPWENQQLAKIKALNTWSSLNESYSCDKEQLFCIPKTECGWKRDVNLSSLKKN